MLPPPPVPSLFSPSFYLHSDFVLLHLQRCSSCLPLVPRSLPLWGSFGSERRFGARLRQYLDGWDGWEPSGSCTGTPCFSLPHQVAVPFRCGGKEFISLIAPLHHHHQRRQFVAALPPYVFSLRLDLFVNLKLTSSRLHAFNERDAGLKLETEVGEIFSSRNFLSGSQWAATCPIALVIGSV